MTPDTGETQPDLVWGTKSIGKVIERNERQTYHLLSTGQIPGKLVGGRWVASRSKLIAFITEDFREGSQ